MSKEAYGLPVQPSFENNPEQIRNAGEINITEGDFYIPASGGELRSFLVKNITASTIFLQVIYADAYTPVSTAFYPGWNVDRVKLIVTDASIPIDALQYGL